MFGIPYENLDLAYLPQYPSEIPACLQALKQYLIHNKGFKTEGIFHIVGREETFLDAKEALDMGFSVDTLEVSVYVCSQLIKAWFREYPLNTPGFFSYELLNCLQKQDQDHSNLSNNKPHSSPHVSLHLETQAELAQALPSEEIQNTQEEKQEKEQEQKYDNNDNNNNITKKNSKESKTPRRLSISKMNENHKLRIIELFKKIEEPIRSLLLWLLDLCIEVAEHEQDNRMSLEALSISFSPNLVRHEDPSHLLRLQQNTQRLWKLLCELRLSKQLEITSDEIYQQDTVNGSGDTERRGTRRSNRTTSVVYSTGVHELYRPSLSTGVFGSYNYPLKESFHSLRRSVALHSEEFKMQALGIEHEPAFRLSWMGDDKNDDEVELDITDSEHKLVQKLRDLLEERHGYANVPRSELLRYVIGCKHRLDIAERRFLRLKRLEREYGLNDVALHQVRDELKKPCYILAGHDKEGRAIIGFRISQFDKNAVDVSVMMKSVLILADALTADLQALRHGVVLLLDMNGLNTKNFSFELQKVFITAFQDAYPLRIKQFMIVNAPFLIRGVIRCARPFLSNKMRDRITSVKTGTALWKLVDKEQVPACIGGTFDINNDGSQPITAWQYVVGRISGDLPDLTVKSNRSKKDVQPKFSDENIGNDDGESTQNRKSPKRVEINDQKEESNNADGRRNSTKTRAYKQRKDFSPSEDDVLERAALVTSPTVVEPNLQTEKTPEFSPSTEAIIHSVDEALSAKSPQKRENTENFEEKDNKV